MFIVVFGSRDRDKPEDREYVNALLDALRLRYPSLVVVSASCDKGVGKFVKDKCLAEKEKFKFIEVMTKVYCDLARPKLAAIFNARNETLVEMGDKFHLFISAAKAGNGTINDLLHKALKASRPCVKHLPGHKFTTLEECDATMVWSSDGGDTPEHDCCGV